MQRYFLTTPFDDQNDESWIEGEDAKHISRVMRMSAGDSIIAVSENEAYVSSILEVTTEGVRVKRNPDSLLPNREMPVSVSIACGLPKGDKLDYIVQKGTELGMTALLPFEAERSIVKWDAKKGGKKVERLQKIAKEAAEQCHRTVIPEVKEPVSITNLLAEASHYDVLLVADEEDAKSNEPNRIADRLKNVYHKQSVLVVFGPEGGISRKEAELLKSAGFLSVSLGPRILRTETAPLYVLSAMSYEFE
ncbi:ribosomal RNA small subunit methyltransferase E [Sporosarcina sp. NCCP-2222]|uniref:16S rRNA (uracil(1498)-N(3))-methyltransferase n=1 Tax=Sporosarcina sp. NCCP-2222 TaxID=2935073 RepID=UPI00207F7D65|nr:16S rRNA (uracil(1498)-N(3))-methyltransferase [Sporosarcina sp. NCCP-2222]GKV54339.1 ribosomal RNA small subunit methyltransferase E [Sporosarcina sp. NCCP-2222]